MIVLGIANTSEAGPSDVSVVGEVVDQIFSLTQLLEIAGAPDTAFEKC